MKLLTLMLFLSALFGCATVSRNEAIIGVWERPKVSGHAFYFEKVAYRADGLKCSAGIGIDEHGELDYGFYVSEWKIVGNSIHLKVKASSSEYLPPGYEIIDEIVRVNKTQLIVKMVKPPTDGIEKYERVANLNSDQICSLALGHGVVQPLE